MTEDTSPDRLVRRYYTYSDRKAKAVKEQDPNEEYNFNRCFQSHIVDMLETLTTRIERIENALGISLDNA
jgi:hypothetical protein